MPTARGALNAKFINKILYAVGGSSDKPLPTNEAYDPSANTWKHKAAMPTARHHARFISNRWKIICYRR